MNREFQAQFLVTESGTLREGYNIVLYEVSKAAHLPLHLVVKTSFAIERGEVGGINYTPCYHSLLASRSPESVQTCPW
jgi:hypothetical protein